MRGDNPSPTIDLIFRKLFGSEENKDLLISLVGSIVSPSIQVIDVEIKNPFNLAAYQGSKESIVDIKAMDQDGTWYTIEMQMHGHILYGKRALYYAAKCFVDQLGAGCDFAALNPTIGIHFLGFDLFDDPQMVRQFMFHNVETREPSEELSHLQLYFVELGKFHKEWDQIDSLRDLWVAFMTHGERLRRGNLPAKLLAEPLIVKAVAELERMGVDPTIRELYESEEKARMADVAQLEWADKQGEKRGREQGMRHLLRRQMRRHIGEIPARISARLNSLAPDQLDDLGEALFDLHSYDDVEAWLARR